MVHGNLDVILTMGAFFFFYITRLMNGRWVSLESHQGKAIFVSHSNHYKYWKDKFACVNGREDSLGVLGADGTPLFPLSKINNHIEITGYEKEFLTL